jgi:hypothetical protein
MKNEEFDTLMNMKPSDFYLWLWRKQARHDMSLAESKIIARKYEEHNAEMLDIISQEDEPIPDFIIQEPIWETKSIGLAEDKLEEENIIEIAYRTKDGTKLYPHFYTLTKEKALTYPTKKIKNHTLRIIPMRELTIK